MPIARCPPVKARGTEVAITVTEFDDTDARRNHNLWITFCTRFEFNELEFFGVHSQASERSEGSRRKTRLVSRDEITYI